MFALVRFVTHGQLENASAYLADVRFVFRMVAGIEQFALVRPVAFVLERIGHVREMLTLVVLQGYLLDKTCRGH